MVATLVFSCKKAAFDRCTAALRHDVVRRTYFTVAYGSDVQEKKKGKQQPGRPRLCSASAMSLANSFTSLTLVTRFDIDLHRPLAGSAPPPPCALPAGTSSGCVLLISQTRPRADRSDFLRRSFFHFYVLFLIYFI